MAKTAIEEVQEFLKDAQTYYLATVEGDQPRVRPFGTAEIFEGRLYIQTGRKKDVFSQLQKNPKAEVCAFKDGQWLRVAGKLVFDDRREPEVDMLQKNPALKGMYAAGDGNTAVLYFDDAEATFSSFTAAPRTVKF
jgi:uncharacterized pyridoxamine 5'-phosphate oxidase family protein